MHLTESVPPFFKLAFLAVTIMQYHEGVSHLGAASVSPPLCGRVRFIKMWRMWREALELFQALALVKELISTKVTCSWKLES